MSNIGWLLFCCISWVGAKEIILSAGVGDLYRQQLENQYYAYKTYSELGMITTASILAYELTEDGLMGVYSTHNPGFSAEDYQLMLKNNLGLKALPCLYCDATIGACANLSDRLENVYANQDNFIIDSVTRAKLHGWEGYSVDLEPDTFVDPNKLTNFILNWAKNLTAHGLILSVWIGGPTQYDLERLCKSSIVKLVTMDTYTMNYDRFINVASQLYTVTVDIQNMGFGLLALRPSNQTYDIADIMHWLKTIDAETISIWASSIPPAWYESLISFLAK